jgi:uncharacterized protein YciI
MGEKGPHQLLFYDYVPDILKRRAPHREAHLAHARAAKEQGLIVMAGAIGDPPHGAVFVIRGDDTAAVEEFVQADPYLAANLVTGWRVEPWKVV